MISRVLVANRAEIASRVFRTCREMGISTVAVFSDADQALPYVAEADLSINLPGNSPAETYLRGDLIIAAAKLTKAEAIHPGYGFLSENADFARAVVDAGLIWIGPTPKSMDSMASKVGAKAIMKAAGVPVLEAPESPTEADLPLLVKASAGGGGRGMRIVRSLESLDSEVAKARAEAESAFGDGTVFVEPYVETGRHIEVQVMSTEVVGDRDCSIQRRHQKVVEEAPAPGLPDHVRSALHDAARATVEAIDYVGAGTVEFLYDPAKERFWFLEMNTRLQVEHPVTEETTGLDLVELQILTADPSLSPSASLKAGVFPVESRVISGRKPGFLPDLFSIEVRLYAEEPAADYAPQTGVLTAFDIPSRPGIRVESGFAAGNEVSTFYDAMVAKVISTASTRAGAARQLANALNAARIHGLNTNRDQLVAILNSAPFLAEEVSTQFLAAGPFTFPGSSEALEPIQGHPDSMSQKTVRLAGALAILARAAENRTVQQRIPAGWRNVVSAPVRIEYDDDTFVDVLGTRDGFTSDLVRVVRASSSQVTLDIYGIRASYNCVVRGLPGAETVDVDSVHGHLHLARKPRFVDPSSAAPVGSLVAPMPGSVVSVAVAEGDTVTEGQPLLVLEAMKMQHTVVAPTAGVVSALRVAVGHQVTGGDVLIIVEEEAS